MLPDFPVLKHDLDEIFTTYLQNSIRRQSGEIGNIDRHRLFEGKGDAISRQGEEAEETKMIEASAEMMFTPEEIVAFSVKDIRNKLDEIARRMADQMVRHLYQTVSDACDKSGNVTKSKGGFTPDVVLEAMSKIHIDFDEHGKPRLPSIHIHPSQTSELYAALQTLDTDPEYKAKSKALMEQKEREWRDREASRKLVG